MNLEHKFCCTKISSKYRLQGDFSFNHIYILISIYSPSIKFPHTKNAIINPIKLRGSFILHGKHIQFHKFGNPKDVLQVEYKNIEPLKENEVLVRMLVRPINPSDLIPITGAYAHRIPLPNIPGYEGVGIVEDVGAGVTRELIGKRVLPLRGEGTWQEYVKTSADFVVPIPDSIDDFTAAQMYINPLTAWVTCTETLNLQRNDVLLVNACGSAIGHLLRSYQTF